jgi:serine/threonine protein kinase
MLTQRKDTHSIKDKLNTELSTIFHEASKNLIIFEVIAEYWVYFEILTNQVFYRGLEYSLGTGLVVNSGAFGIVTLFKANDEKSAASASIPTELAIKTPKGESNDELYLNETLIWNIVYPQNPSYLYTSVNSELPLLFMPALGHKTLYEWMRLPNTTTIAKLEIFLAAAIELQRIHQLSIIHKDITANNILVTLEKGVFRVNYIDFGISYDHATFFDDEIRDFCKMVKYNSLFYHSVDDLNKVLDDVIHKKEFYSLEDIIATIKVELANPLNSNNNTSRISL